MTAPPPCDHPYMTARLPAPVSFMEATARTELIASRPLDTATAYWCFPPAPSPW